MIIFRLFISQVLKTTFATTVIVISIFLVLRGMIFLGQAADGLIPVIAVFKLVALALIANLDAILPLMFYIGLLMVLNRWYNDREMVVLASAGVGPAGFIKPLVLLNCFVVALVAILSFYVTPSALQAGYVVEQQYRESNEVSGIQTGRFVEAQNGKVTYFVEAYDPNRGLYQNVFVNQSDVDSDGVDREGIVRANTAYTELDNKTQSQFLILIGGTRYEGIAGSSDYNIVEFEKYALRIDPPTHSVAYLPPKARSTAMLLSMSDEPGYSQELTWRIAKVFVFPILSIFALAFSYVDTRSNKAGGLVAAFVVYLLYSNLLGYAEAMFKKGEVDSGAVVWLVHLSFALIAAVCLYLRNNNFDFQVLMPSRKLKLT